MKTLIRLSVLFSAALLCSFFASCAGGSGEEASNTRRTEETEAAKEIVKIENGDHTNSDFMKNPLGVTKIGDPFILYEDGTYYMYATYSDGEGFYCWTSKTCSSWTQYGRVYAKSASSYGTLKHWAPEVYKHGGKYYMFYSSKKTDATFHAVSVAVADKPTGPFTDYVTPLYNPEFSVIDANVLFDDDGRIYLYYSKDGSTNIINGCKTSQIYGVELSSDMKSLIGEPVLLATPEQSWEKQSGSSQQWNEGPCVFKNGGVYYLMYSANYYKSAAYSVGYATSASPLGAYAKYSKNPILKGDGTLTSGTGHNNIFTSPDGGELFVVYHSLTNPGGEYEYRQLCVDRMLIQADGTLYVNGPTLSRQPVPSGTRSVTVLPAGGFTVSCTDGSVSDSTLATLYDGSISKGRLLFKPDAELEISFVEAESLSYLLIYPTSFSYLFPAPASVSALINGEYLISDVLFIPSPSKSPAVISFYKLPEGVLISDIRLSFTAGEDGGECSVSEITAVRKSE